MGGATYRRNVRLVLGAVPKIRMVQVLHTLPPIKYFGVHAKFQCSYIYIGTSRDSTKQKQTRAPGRVRRLPSKSGLCVRFRFGSGFGVFLALNVGLLSFSALSKYFCFVALSLSLSWLALPHTAGCPVQMKPCSPVFASLSLIRGS